MICPVCHTQIADEATVCPACHADLSTTRVMPKLSGTWCASCGALVPAGAAQCPKCGVAVAGASQAQTTQRMRANYESQDAAETAVMPRIESAIPSEPSASEDVSYGQASMNRTKVFLFAALASLIIVGGSILLITHPWNPDQNNQRATTPADTTQAGFPGAIDRLSGQDSDTTAQSSYTSDEQAYMDLMAAYTSLDELRARADALDEALDEAAISGTDDTRAANYDQTQTLSIDVSNLATSISKIETSSTDLYTEDKEHLTTLVNWLRNRIEAIEKAWQLSAESSDPVADESKIMAPMQGNRASDGDQAYVNLFAANFDAWAPQERS